MIDPRVIFTIVFFVALSGYVFARRKEMQEHKILPPFLYFSMYRTTWGLTAMDSWAGKYNKPLRWLGTAGIIAGFLGMVFISYALIRGLFQLFANPSAAPGVAPVLPIKANGIFYVPIEYWIICIFVVALVHEFAHGVIARVYGIKVKSSGFAFLGTSFRALGAIVLLIGVWGRMKDPNALLNLTSSPDLTIFIGLALILVSFFIKTVAPIIPAAFVEPDEKKLRKKPLKQQLAVFAAGPFSNVIVGLIALGLLLPFASLSAKMVEANGVEIADVVNGDFPAKVAGLQKGEVVQQINGIPTKYVNNLSKELKGKIPGDTIQLKTDKGQYSITLAKNPKNQTAAYMGASLSQSSRIKPGIKESYGMLPGFIVWITGLLRFMFLLNIGIGLFNLVPIGPLDGGRMLHAVLMKYVEKEKAVQLFGMIGLVFTLVVLANILFPFVKPLF